MTSLRYPCQLGRGYLMRLHHVSGHVYRVNPGTSSGIINRLARLAGLPAYPDAFLRDLETAPDGYRWWTIAVPGRSRQPVGFAVFRLLAPEAELLDMAVLPWFRRRGLGRALLAHARRRLQREGVTHCHLEVRSSNRAARELYLAHGFRVAGTRRPYYRDPSADAVLMTAEFGCPPTIFSA
jgi:[ribosomal protein S18]-alanine N-acetyltransferase